MNSSLTPDGAEEDMGSALEEAVPASGYQRLKVVGIGACASEHAAVAALLAAVPEHSGLAFVVVSHGTGPAAPDWLAAVRPGVRLRLAELTGSTRMEPDTAYFVPAQRGARALDDSVLLTDGQAGNGRMVVDLFLRSLADSHGAHAAAVVLGGTSGDGAIGVKRIKERGGLTVAQDPDEAAHDAMPRAAVDTGMVDWVLPVAEIPRRLLEYFRLESRLRLPPEEGAEAAQPARPAGGDEAPLRDVLALLRTRTGRDFAHYKRATILRRIARRMQVNGVETLPEYLHCLRTRSGEPVALLQDLLITVTNFFRDAACFQALQAQLPALFEGKGTGDAVRVWVAACATGEEAYSVAMLLAEHARTLAAPPLVQVFATDLDDEALAAAREGVYPVAIEADVSEERLRRFFVKEHRGYRVRRELREMVLFAVHDVLKDSPFSRLDLVSCRNLLIYLGRDAQRRVFDIFHFALVPGGKLFLGASEAVEEGSAQFTVVDKKHRIYAHRPMPRTGLPVPSGAGTLARALELQQAARDGPVTAGLAFKVDDVPGRAELALAGGSAGSWGEVHLRLLEQLAPPSILVDGEYDIVHLSPSAGRYLRYAGGEPTRNLLRALPPGLRIELRAALYQAGQDRLPVEVPAVPLVLDGGTVTLTIRVTPVVDLGADLFLVVLQPQQANAVPVPGDPARPAPDPLAHHLDRELERLKTHLRDTVEQYEASTEELKASNEELQAMNEELRSATEELETSREELQSINEELTTVNHELKNKVDELGHANSDMQNLMDATAIATVFLDRELRITRYTPSAVSLFNLIPTDVGRPLTDLTTHLQYPELGDDARGVLERLVPVEREMGQAGGRWFLARLLPYRTLDDRIAGVVLAFVDITERKRAEEMQLWLSAVVGATSDGIVSFTPDQTILSWNGGAERIFGYTAQEAIGQPLALLAPPGASREPLVDWMASAQRVEQLETVRQRRDGSAVDVALTVSPIRDARGRVVAGTAIVRDISAVRATAEALRRSDERLRATVERIRAALHAQQAAGAFDAQAIARLLDSDG